MQTFSRFRYVSSSFTVAVHRTLPAATSYNILYGQHLAYTG